MHMNTFTNPTSSFTMLGRGCEKVVTLTIADRLTSDINDDVYIHLCSFYGEPTNRSQRETYAAKALVITAKLITDQPIQVSL
jgi:hypothetical protein